MAGDVDVDVVISSGNGLGFLGVGMGRLIEGLSQEEKKSSSGSPAGVEVPSAASVAASEITTSLGYLCIN